MHQLDAAQDISPTVTARRERYDTLTIALHWITALLLVAQFAFAFAHDQVSDAETRRALLAAHRSLGAIMWFVVAGRLLWRVLWMRLPAFPATMTNWHKLGTKLSEWALYALLLTQPLSGVAASVLRGRPFDLFWTQVPALVRPDQSLATALQSLHMLGAYFLAGLVLIHASAAILHRVIADDGVLGSMMPLFVSRTRGDSTNNPQPTAWISGRIHRDSGRHARKRPKTQSRAH
jgi:cytochrome b561